MTWKDSSAAQILQYDFVPAPEWSAEQLAAAQAAVLAALEAIGVAPVVGPQAAWMPLARLLPDALRAALIAELRAGNVLLGIGSTGWPVAGSVVVTLRERFRLGADQLQAGLRWRQRNDPHYCREEISQISAGIEHLLLA